MECYRDRREAMLKKQKGLLKLATQTTRIKTMMLFLAFATMGALAVGCSSKSNEGSGKNVEAVSPETKPPEPVTLTIRTTAPESEFQSTVAEPIRKKFPHVTVVMLGAEHKLADLIAAKQLPDMIFQAYTNMAEIIDIDYPMDLDEMVKKYGADLNRFAPGIIENIRANSPDNQLLVYPRHIQPFALHYNKALFDKFGVPYPKEGSTWDDLIELSARLARTEGGVHYRGLDAGLSINRMQMQLSLPYVDGKTEKSAVASNPGWKKLFETYKSIYGVPGNFPEGAQYGDGSKAFLETQSLAMYPHIVLLRSAPYEKAVKEGLDMGITTYPVFQDTPGVGTGLFGGGFAIYKNSKNKDIAFQIAMHFASDEVQAELSEQGIVTSLANADVQKKLYEGYEYAKNMDTSVIFKVRVAHPVQKTAYDGKAQTIAQASLQNMFTGKVDINTALQNVDEQINKMVETEKSK